MQIVCDNCGSPGAIWHECGECVDEADRAKGRLVKLREENDQLRANIAALTTRSDDLENGGWYGMPPTVGDLQADINLLRHRLHNSEKERDGLRAKLDELKRVMEES